MVEKLWVYNFDTATVDWAYAYPGSSGNERWIRRTDGDGTETRETIGYGVFLTERGATMGLLNALVANKDELESEIEKVKRQLASFQ